MNPHDAFIVLTGGPGGGKTSLIEALAQEGFRTAPESGRAVIRQELARGGSALPWDDRAAYAKAIAARDDAAHAAACRAGGITIFDRGLPDVLGYLALCGLPVPDDLARAARRLRYTSPVFLAPFWPEIYAGDAERRQDAAEAAETARAMRRTYEGLGYEVTDLPLAPVPKRVRFLRERMRL
ncbi:ATPase [Aureimonas ureilytica]|uniref:ATPase n=1 Tax=Aureimonas ureilytica TaxID=401562 RepID=A0A175R4W7_9HYPH|nr:AAA family ATPase [Aureimonas ureilytica]KTQ89638.1 ATPase [Aureimonas ureilytica]